MTKRYAIYYNDHVNEPVILDRFDSLTDAKCFADNEVEGHAMVEEDDNVDIFGNASTARIEVYDGDMFTILDNEPHLNEAVYTTEYFYIN